jgi:hypothetical protein
MTKPETTGGLRPAADRRETIARIIDPWAFEAFSTSPLMEIARHRLTALAKADQIIATETPEGWVLVPREPTREMWAAMGNALVGHRQRHHDKVAEDLWNGALAAAGNPPPQDEKPVSPIAPAEVTNPGNSSTFSTGPLP